MHAQTRRRDWIQRFARLPGLNRLVRDETGGTVVYLALVFPICFGAAGLAIDVASWYGVKRTVQAAVDAAAYAAALHLAEQGLATAPNLAALRAAAADAAGRNGVLSPITVNIPPGSGLAAGDPSAIEVIVSEPAPLHFTALFLGAAAPAVTARSVAKAVVTDACVWSLHPSAKGALTVSGGADVGLACGVVVNSDHPEAALDQSGSSCLSATSITIAGRYSGSCVSPTPEILTPSYGDPLSSLAEPPVGGCDYNTKIQVSSGESVTLTPGVYCKGMSINGDVVLEPGLYVVHGDGIDIQSNAHVTNDENAYGGVTIYLTGGGTKYADVNIASGSRVRLTPMTAAPLANVLFFQDRNARNAQSKFTGQSQMDLEGILYFPNSEVEFTGGSEMDEADVLLVASTVKVTGNTYLNADYARSLLPKEYYARFVE